MCGLSFTFEKLDLMLRTDSKMNFNVSGNDDGSLLFDFCVQWQNPIGKNLLLSKRS